MSWKGWTGKSRWMLGAAAALLSGSLALAQEAPLLPPPAPPPVGDASINQRLEKLEKQNEALQKQNEYLLKILENVKTLPAVSEGPDAAPVSKTEVQQIVTEYLQDREKAEEKAAAAQKAKGPATAGWHEVGSDFKLSANWNNGVVLESAQKDFKAHFGGRFNMDWVWWGEPVRLTKSVADGGLGVLEDGVSLRRARLQTDGTLWEVFEWNLEMDFSAATDIRFDDFYIGLTQLPVIGNFRVGNVKVPQGLENYTSSRHLTFMERAAPFDAFLTEYDPGFIFFNTLFDQRMTWAACFHRVDPEDDMIDYGTGDYAATGRLSCLPVWENEGRCLVHLGASGQYRAGEFSQAAGERFLNFRSRPELRSRQAGFPNVIDTPAIQCDHENQVGFEVATVWGPLSIQAEYFYNMLDNARSSGVFRGDVNFQGWYIYASYFLTGENRRYDRRLGRFDRLIPNENFFWVKDPDADHRSLYGTGAWEVALRYTQVDLNDSGIHGGILNSYTAALNWYWNPNMRVQLNWVISDRDVHQPRIPGLFHGVGLRFHYDF